MTITVVTPVSPIPQHPEFSILRETLESVRHHLPDAEIILTFDGVRPEQEDRREAYEEAIARILWWAAKELGGVCPWLFDQHIHQVGMLRHVLDDIRTPLLLYVEQDAPLEPDPIDWQACTDLVLSGKADVVRFSHESEVLPAHRHMAIGEVENGFLRTCQYSARPHLASVAWYRRALEYFSPDANTFLEDLLHGVCHEAYKLDGMTGWHSHRIWLYHPEGSIRRSRHLDGRAGDPKYDNQLVF